MRVLRQFDALVIDDFKERVYSYPDHGHTYFEMVYIHDGCGNHHLNKNIIPFNAGDLFIMSPGDHHFFDIRKTTHFTFIKFTESYYDTQLHLMPNDHTAFAPAAIMQLKVFKENKFAVEEPYRSILKRTVENIVLYNQHVRDISSSPVIFYQLFSILSMIRDTAQRMYAAASHQNTGDAAMAAYIHQYIYDREKLQVPAIAAYFDIAPGYFSKYFKGKFGIKYLDYVAQYRNKLIEKRLVTFNQTVKEIADEFGFTDESHFIKYFRKHYRINPSAFRMQPLQGAE